MASQKKGRKNGLSLSGYRYGKGGNRMQGIQTALNVIEVIFYAAVAAYIIRRWNS